MVHILASITHLAWSVQNLNLVHSICKSRSRSRQAEEERQKLQLEHVGSNMSKTSSRKKSNERQQLKEPDRSKGNTSKATFGRGGEGGSGGRTSTKNTRGRRRAGKPYVYIYTRVYVYIYVWCKIYFPSTSVRMHTSMCPNAYIYFCKIYAYICVSECILLLL